MRDRKLGWRVYREIGVILSEEAHYRPEPEISVVDARFDDEKSHADKFYLVAEVLSASNHDKYGKQEESAIQAKLRFYRDHPHNRCILIIEQDRPQVTIHQRAEDGTWPAEPLVMRDAAAEIVIQDIGPLCTLGALYEGTSVDPLRASRPST